jgi:hypothetical protein
MTPITRPSPLLASHCQPAALSTVPEGPPTLEVLPGALHLCFKQTFIQCQSLVTSSTLIHYTTAIRMKNTVRNSSQHYNPHTLLQVSHFHFPYSNPVDKLWSSK